jgi:hypothetical protein
MANSANTVELEPLIEAMKRIAEGTRDKKRRGIDPQEAKHHRIGNAIGYSARMVRGVWSGEFPASNAFIRAVHDADPGRVVEVVREITDPTLGYGEETWAQAFSKALQSEDA